jgi:hypothetical protein
MIKEFTHQAVVSGIAPSQLLPAVQPSQGWEQFYTSLTSAGNVPHAGAISITSEDAIFSGNYLDINEVQKQLISSGITPNITTIYTDVLNVNNLVAWKLQNNTALVIYARLIEFNAGGSFYVNFASATVINASLTIFSAGTNGEIIVNVGDGNSGNLSLNSSTISPGIEVVNSTTGIQSRILSLSDGFPTTITPIQENYLMNSFILGALSSDEYPQIAMDILSWVNGWAGASLSTNAADLTQLFFQSSSLAALFQSQIIAEGNGATYVPFLSSSLYAGIATTLGNAISSNLTNYITLFSLSTVNADFITSATTLKSIYNNDVANYQSLLAQAQTDYNNALAAVNTAKLNFLNQQATVTITGNTLKTGIANYKLYHELEVAIEIVTAVIKFGIGIAGMVTGNEETAPAAADGISEAVAVGEEAAETAELMKKLKKLVEILNKVYELANSIYTASQSIGNPSNPINPATAGATDLQPGDAINGVAAWTVFQINADSSLQSVIKLSIDGAQEYKDALDILAAYGQALSATQVAVIKASQKVVELNVKIYYANQNVAAIMSEVANLQVGQTDILSLQHLFYQQFLNTKLTLYAILKSYQATYYYWALMPYPNPVTLANLNSITGSETDLVNMSLDTYQALNKFGAGTEIQTLSSVFVPVIDSMVLNTLQKTGATQWIIGLDNESFDLMDRVRVTTVRVWLDGEGLYPTNRTKASIIINSSGNYQDRLKSQDFQFNSAPLHNMLFEYTVGAKGSSSYNFPISTSLVPTINVDGSAALGVGNDYFEPTPFGEWSINLSNSGIDFTKVTSIVMEFKGSIICNPSTLKKM